MRLEWAYPRQQMCRRHIFSIFGEAAQNILWPVPPHLPWPNLLLPRKPEIPWQFQIFAEGICLWNVSTWLDIETDYAKWKFIESFFINSQNNSLNDRDSVAFPKIYQNLLVPALHEKLHGSVVNSVSGVAMTSNDVLICMDLVFLLLLLNLITWLCLCFNHVTLLYLSADSS